MMHSFRIQRTYTTHQAVWCSYWGLGDFQVLIETFLWQGHLPSCKRLCAGSQWFGDTITCGVLVRTFRGWLGQLGLDYTFTWDHWSSRLKLIILIASTLCVARWRNWTAEETISFLWEWLQVEADSFKHCWMASKTIIYLHKRACVSYRWCILNPICCDRLSPSLPTCRYSLLLYASCYLLLAQESLGCIDIYSYRPVGLVLNSIPKEK